MFLPLIKHPVTIGSSMKPIGICWPCLLYTSPELKLSKHPLHAHIAAPSVNGLLFLLGESGLLFIQNSLLLAVCILHRIVDTDIPQIQRILQNPVGAVSYTHLDVYKRQLRCCLCPSPNCIWICQTTCCLYCICKMFFGTVVFIFCIQNCVDTALRHNRLCPLWRKGGNQFYLSLIHIYLTANAADRSSKGMFIYIFFINVPQPFNCLLYTSRCV